MSPTDNILYYGFVSLRSDAFKRMNKSYFKNIHSVCDETDATVYRIYSFILVAALSTTNAGGQLQLWLSHRGDVPCRIHRETQPLELSYHIEAHSLDPCCEPNSCRRQSNRNVKSTSAQPQREALENIADKGSLDESAKKKIYSQH